MDPVDVLGQDSLDAAVRAAGIAAPGHWFDEVGSTNAEALRLAEEGAPEWTVVAAGHQTAGRGRLGRSWVERPGRGLLVSLVLRPPLGAETLSVVSLLAAVEMSRACAQLAGLEVRCKWPNDLLIGRRKVGGILSEASVGDDGVVRHVVVGTGVNVAMEADDFPDDVRATATSLNVEGGPVHPALLLRTYLEGMRTGYRSITSGSTAGVLTSYRDVCVTLGRWVRATTTSGETVEGLAVDLDDRGGLIVDVGRRREVVAFGEVHHLDRPP
jgi:BirA family transcriptional regulator, biotin operon repressor / biotin---[acetyl-CoA-carboxylase] ligase